MLVRIITSDRQRCQDSHAAHDANDAHHEPRCAGVCRQKLPEDWVVPWAARVLPLSPTLTCQRRSTCIHTPQFGSCELWACSDAGASSDTYLYPTSLRGTEYILSGCVTCQLSRPSHSFSSRLFFLVFSLPHLSHHQHFSRPPARDSRLFHLEPPDRKVSITPLFLFSPPESPCHPPIQTVHPHSCHTTLAARTSWELTYSS